MLVEMHANTDVALVLGENVPVWSIILEECRLSPFEERRRRLSLTSNRQLPVSLLCELLCVVVGNVKMLTRRRRNHHR